MINGQKFHSVLFITGLLLLSLLFTVYAKASPSSKSKQRISLAYSEDSLPFHYTDDNGQPAGMIIGQWLLWSKKTNIAVDFIPASWDETLRMVGDGRADAHAGLFHNAERDKYLDYGSDLTKTDTHVFLHKALPPIIHLHDLAAYRVVKDYVKGYLKEKLPDATVIVYSDYNQIMEVLHNGHIRDFVADTPTGIYHLQHYGLAGDYPAATDEQQGTTITVTMPSTV
jgi:ABC-type amino acid transport substrate-binding protein